MLRAPKRRTTRRTAHQRGYTYRWSGTEWVRSSCKLEKLLDGGWVLRQPKPVPRVHSEFALPPSSLRQR